VNLRTTRSGFVDMMGYISKPELIPDGADYSKYASMRALLLWVAYVRPDVSAFVSIVASITKATFVSKDHVDAMNEKILTLKAMAHMGVQFPKLDYDSSRLVTYVEGSFANREGKSSQF
jgi:hypothetical protein